MDNKRLIRFTAKYLQVLANVMATNDVRYYLNGIFVQPHESGEGVYLVATNGHHMVAIYDRLGYANDEWICEISKSLVTASKKKGNSRNLFLGRADEIQFIGDSVYVISVSDHDEHGKPLLPLGQFSLEATEFGQLTENVIHCEYATHIEGKYPDWKRVIPETIEKTGNPLVNPNYFEFAKTIGNLDGAKGFNGMQFFAKDENSSTVIRFPNMPEIVGLIMPVRGNPIVAIPDWIIREEKPSIQEAA